MDFVARARAELAKLREDQQLTQEELGDKAGFSKSTVSRIENVDGEPDHVPDLDTIEKWVLACGAELADFFSRVTHGRAGLDHAVGEASPSDDQQTDALRTPADPFDIGKIIVAATDLLGEHLATSLDQLATRLEAALGARAGQAPGRSPRKARRDKGDSPRARKLA